ncbi:hypothetical protein ACQ856_26160 [Mycolicibacterium psychrotolerans]
MQRQDDTVRSALTCGDQAIPRSCAAAASRCRVDWIGWRDDAE